MKKILLVLVALAAISFTANAQWYVGGNVGLSATTSNSLIGWNISPDGGYILNDNMAVGASLVFAGTGASDGADSSVSTFQFNVVPYYKWAFWTVNSFRFWLQGEIGLGVYTSTNRYLDQKYSSSAFSWAVAVAPAISYNITDKWCINTKIASIGVSGIGSGTTFTFMAINGPSIGVQYNF